MRDKFRGKDFLSLLDFKKEEILFILETAAELKQKWARREPHDFLRGKCYAMIFEKNSTRTRTSFQAGAAQLGAQTFYMRPSEMQLSRGEPIKDTARVLDRYCDGLFIRTFEQEIVEEFAKHMKNPVINALTNFNHPCQGLADLMTIKEKKGDFKGLKLSYTGDVYNIVNTLLAMCSMTGMHLYVGRPEGYNPDSEVLKKAQELAKYSGSKIVFTSDIDETFSNADVVYGNVWTSMGDHEKPEEKKKRLEAFKPFQINMDAMKKAKDDAIFMHCLPAHRGEDTTDEVLESKYSVVWDEAENRMHTEKAILVLTSY